MTSTARTSLATDRLLPEAEQLSRAFVTHYYQHDIAWCVSHCEPDMSYLGTTEDVQAHDLASFAEIMSTTLAKFYPSLAHSIETKAFVLDKCGLILVLVHLVLVHSPLSGHLDTSKKTITLLWRKHHKELRLRHMHASTPYVIEAYTEGEERLTNETYRYVKAILDQVIRRRGVTLRDTEGTTHLVSAAEVRYVEAQRQYCIVHCLSQDIEVRRGFSELVGQFGEDLITVHRSFAVSPLYVKTINRDEVTLDDGTVIPLPQRRAAEIREQLLEAIDRVVAESSRFRAIPPRPLSLPY